MRTLQELATAATLLAGLAGPALAADTLLANGSFETGLAGWTTTGSVSTSTAQAVDGLQSAVLADAAASLTWTLATPLAVDSIASFSLWAMNPTTLTFSLVGFGYADGSSSTTLIENFDTNSWTRYLLNTSDLTAGQTLASFTVYGNTEGATYLDAVALQAVPEPGALWLLAVGLPLLWARRHGLAAGMHKPA